jgi:hypothetical protein
MSFFRNFTFNITQNTDIELQDIEEGSGSVLTSSNIPASTPISHPLSAFTSNLTQNPDIEIRDIEEGSGSALTSSNTTQVSHPLHTLQQDAGYYPLPNFSLATSGDVPTPADIPNPPYAETLGSDQDAQTTQAPIENPLIPGDCTMTGPDNPHPETHAHQLLPPADIQPGPTSARKRSHHERERTDKVRVVEQSSRLPVCPYILRKETKKC